MTRFSSSFESRLAAPPERVWERVTSLAGIRAELAPLVRMTAPPGASSLRDLDVELGRPLGRSWILLLGWIPVPRCELTLTALEPGRGFVEQSPALGLRLWRHERAIAPCDGGCVLADRIDCEPQIADALVQRGVEALFRHRHRVLRSELGTAPPPPAAGG